MLTPSKQTLPIGVRRGSLPRLVHLALLVPEAGILALTLLAHQLLGAPAWTALVGLVVGLAFAVRLGLLTVAGLLLQRAAYGAARRLTLLALRLHPWSADGLGLLASIELAQGDPDAAVVALRHAVRLLPGQYSLHAALSGALLDQEQLIEAREQALLALGARPRDAVALLHFAGVERCLHGPTSTVESLLRRGLAAQPAPADEAALCCVLAEVLAEQGRHAEAALAMKRVETLVDACATPQQAALHCHLAQLCVLYGEGEQATAHFQAAEQLDPAGRYAQDAWSGARR